MGVALYVCNEFVFGKAQINNTGSLSPARCNISSDIYESKICLYDGNVGVSNGPMVGMGVSSSYWNFQIPSTAWYYRWLYGGTNGNDTGTQLMILNSTGLGIGVAGAPAYKLHVGTDAAYKLTTNTWGVTTTVVQSATPNVKASTTRPWKDGNCCSTQATTW